MRPDLEPYREHGDPLADAVVLEVFRSAEERDGDAGVWRVIDLLNAIIDVEELPRTESYGPAYTHYLDTSLEFPDWYDTERGDHSIDWFRRNGWTALAILGCGSLPAGYSIPEVSNVLGSTQALAKHIKRRLWETAQFVIQVMETDGIVPSENPAVAAGPGALRAQKVRLFHSIVRFLLNPPEEASSVVLTPRLTAPGDEMSYGELLWKRTWHDEWGVPIHQAHMGGTILVFSWAILRGLRILGFLQNEDPSPRQVEIENAFLYRWNVIGHFMGLDPDLMCWDYGSAHDFIMSLDERDPQKQRPQPLLSNDLPVLLESLVSYMKSEVPGWLWFLRPTAPILMYILLEDEDGTGNRADRIHLPISKWERRFAPLQRWSMRAYSAVYRRLGILQRVNAFMYDRLVYTLIGPRDGGDRRMRYWLAPEPRSWRDKKWDVPPSMASPVEG